MDPRSIVSSPLDTFSPQKALGLANLYMETATNTGDPETVLMLCYDTEVSLSQARKTVKRAEDQALILEIAAAYFDLGTVLEKSGYNTEAQASFKMAGELGENLQGISSRFKGISLDSQATGTQHSAIARALAHIFPEDINPPTLKLKLPDPDERLQSTRQLVCCLGILQTVQSADLSLEPAAQQWVQVIEDDTDEQDRLYSMATDLIRVFKRDELKDARAITEIVSLAPVLDKEEFQGLLREFYSGTNSSGLLDVHQLMGLAQMIQGADSSYLGTDDLVKILGLFSDQLRDTHHQSQGYMYKLTLAISYVLDAMADTNVIDLDRKRLHEPLLLYLEELKKSSDPYLVYQAAYAFQALLCVSDDETVWQGAMGRSGKVFQGVAGLVSAAKGLDLNKFIEGLEHMQEGTSNIVDVVQSAYKNVTSLAESGQGFLDCLKDGLSFDCKRDWYSALRGADALIREGKFASFRMLVCGAPCRLDAAFQWGVCQRLGEISSDPRWDAPTRRGAIDFLGEMYKNDDMWGQQSDIKQWILNVLMQMTTLSGKGHKLSVSAAEALLRELEKNGDTKKQSMYRACQSRGPIAYPLALTLPGVVSPSLLDRVQNRNDVEGNIRLLRKHRTVDGGNSIYVQPHAKASLEAADSTRFPLMEKVKEFLADDQKVFIVLGDSGAGKSTFKRQLELELWESYKSKTGRIPLFINLPAIDKPEHEMIAKQLRKADFTEPQIREMKYHCKFTLICDGYDDSQQTHNLYISNKLNQAGEWDAQMVISCRTGYLGSDYRSRFQPRGHNSQSDPSQFQEAVITPFSPDQIHDYIHQYVSLHQPLWQANDYKQALDRIPSLKDLVQNPFLMTLSLEVLPRIVDPGQQLSSTNITRVVLYDHLVEQWLERSKRRMEEKDLAPQTRAIFERLSEEGFTQSGIDFIKRLSVAIYMNQGGQPVVEYSQFQDKGSWKDDFFIPEDMRLLREACPMSRNGNRHRFLHRSLLEYALACAVFDPQERGNRTSSESFTIRRGSVSSTLSFEIEEPSTGEVSSLYPDPDPASPLVWRSFVNDHSLMQFLEERVQEEPVFKQQLLAYIENSKWDKKWRMAAANAITILVRSGMQFIGAAIQGVQIPGADLSRGVFDSVQFQGADLRNADLRGTWLRQTNLSEAQMGGVRFGELPYLKEDGEAASCAYSPDGKSLAVGLASGIIQLYATSTWERTQTLRQHSGAVRWIAFSLNGNQIASASDDGTILLWDTETGSCQHTLTGRIANIQGVAFSPRDNQIVCCSDGTTIRLWNVATGECSQTLSGHAKDVCCVAFSPNGRRIASGSEDRTIRLWDVENGTCCQILSDHKDGVRSMALVFSPDGNQLASGNEDTTIRLWDLRTGVETLTIAANFYPNNRIVYSPTGGQLASTDMDGSIRLWDVEAGICQHTLTGHTDSVLSVAYSPKGDHIASASLDETVRLWDISTEMSRAVSGGHSAPVCFVRFSPRGTLIASSSLDKKIRLLDTETGACYRTFSGHEDAVFGIAFSPHEDLIVSTSPDKSVRVWEVESGDCKLTITGHEDCVRDVSFSPQGSVVASASDDRTIRLWNLTTGECLRILEGHVEGVSTVIYSPDGSQIASGSPDQTVRIWDAESGECLQVLTGHGDVIMQVVYLHEGERLASASIDSTVRVWDAKTGACCMVLIGHSAYVNSIAYSREGNLLASGSADKTIRLWDATTGQSRYVIQNFVDEVCFLDFNGIYLIAGCQDGSLLKWEVLEDEDQCHVRLCWVGMKGALSLPGASIQNARGLSQLNGKSSNRQMVFLPFLVMNE